jgi:Zn-dependent M28 family amino/carboxypeptidase
MAGCLTDEAPPVAADDAMDHAQHLGAPDVDVPRLLAELKMFVESYSVRKDNSPDHVGARDWIAEQFESYGLEVYRQEFNQGIDQENTIGILWGENRDEWVIVGGHYDTTTTGSSHDDQSQGAYDDGSGTLLTLGLAKAFAARNMTPEYTIAFVAFDGEERGLQGSGNFASFFLDEGLSPYGNITGHAMLNLDMFGLNWPAIDSPIYFDENSDILRQTVEDSRLAMEMPDEMIEYTGITLGRSDYAHFMDRGIPTGFFISNFEKWQVPGGNAPVVGGVVIPQGAYPFWHVSDTYETMVLMAGDEAALLEGFTTAAKLSADFLERAAYDPAPLDVRA